MEARILKWTSEAPRRIDTLDDTKVGQELGVSHSVIATAWKRANLKPHRIARYMASNDPDFERKAADVIGFTSIHRNMLQCSASMRNGHSGLGSSRSGSAFFTWSARATWLRVLPSRHALALRRSGYQSGEVLGKTVARHRAKSFVAFLTSIIVSQQREKKSTSSSTTFRHKSKRVGQFLSEHPTLPLHFTPTYSSWLNQVEIWFSKIERDVIARGVFSSVPDLRRKLMNTSSNTTALCQWSYSTSRSYHVPVIQ